MTAPHWSPKLREAVRLWKDKDWPAIQAQEAAREPRYEIIGGMHKLYPREVNEIRRLWAKGEMTQAELAEMYGVSPSTVSMICGGRTWAAR